MTRIMKNFISLVMAVNKSDWSYGWHGHRAGLALYYFDETILLNEHHELRFGNSSFSKYDSYYMSQN